MTYLGFPRLHFAGSFQADPSTVNNDPHHFDDATFQARYQQPESGSLPDQMNGWWNPRGTGAWRLRNCTVTSVLYADGSSAASTLADPIVGGTLAAADERVSAKIVDLDPEQQMVSEIWGLQLRLLDAAGLPTWSGNFAVAPFSDIWVRYPAGQPDSFFSAVYQSIITDVAWPEKLDSPFLQQLKKAAYQGKLSIKFTTDGFDDTATSPTFTWGRIVGSIGPYLQGEPKHFVAARYLQPPAGGGPLNNAPCRLDEASKTLFLDLGNSLPTTSVGGPLQNPNTLRLNQNPVTGPLQVAALPANGDPVVLAALDSLGGFYEYQAGIISAHLTDAQFAAASKNPIGLVDVTGQMVLLAENPQATYVRADDFVFRMESAAPNNTATTTLYATQFGRPAPNVALNLWQDDSAEQGQVKQGPIAGPPVGIPTGAISFPASVTTGPEGRASVEITARPPGNPRGYIDGQVYGIDYGWGSDASVAGGSNLSLLVFDDYTVPDRPTWVSDVLPVLQQYANLYPVMRDILDLSDYHSVVNHRGALQLVFGLPVSDPNYMPVTRDLSPPKRAMLLKWLAEPAPPLIEVTDLASLRSALQLAIELEHSTIPPYLCALFSIVPGRNREVASIIRSVVIQEMLHMALACNLLNAIGGEPQIDRANFVPKYPGHLPAGLRPDLTVGLTRCTKEQIADVFLSIEEPEEITVESGGAPPTIDTRAVAVDNAGEALAVPPITDDAALATAPSAVIVGSAVASLEQWFTSVSHPAFTIGWFYNQIARAIIALDNQGVKLFVGDPNRQLTPAVWPDPPGRLYKVTDKASALLAIHEIVQQGEGTSLNEPTDSRGELAHYFRFKEIVEGRQMVRNAAGEWVFEGPRIPFDEDGVSPMVDNPDWTQLPPNSLVQAAARLFDTSYADLLRSLHRMANGQPEALREAIGLMYTLEVQARDLMRMPSSPGAATTAGPDFQIG
jgi:hypothetical protein